MPIKSSKSASPSAVIQEKRTKGKSTKQDVPAPAEAATTFLDPNTQLADAIERYADDRDFVTALARGIGVMLALADKRRRMSIAQVSHSTGIPRAAARRSLYTLEKLGFVSADDTRRYFLRPRVLSFSHSYLSASPLAMLAQPVLDNLGASLQQGISIAVPDGEEIVYLGRSTSSRIISPSLNVGRRLPSYCTSIGRVLLAQLSDEELDIYLENATFYQYTTQTVVDPKALRKILMEVRQNGYAYSCEQIEPRLCSLAVPVRDAAGNTVAGLNVILQGRLMSADRMAAEFFQPLYQSALQLGALLVN